MKKTILNLLILSFLVFGFQQVWAVEVDITTDLSFIPWCGSTSCTVWTGFSVVENVMGGIIKYFTYIAALACVLFIVINGILYSMSGMDAGLKDGAKKRIIQTLLGLVILMLAGVILNAVAPWIYK